MQLWWVVHKLQQGAWLMSSSAPTFPVLRHVSCRVLQEEGQQDSQLINSVYLDNSSMELYHGRLDKKPNAIALRIR